jgi:pyruvate dehydrogenase E2 component (dihydrolipoamide acetyltransferase)
METGRIIAWSKRIGDAVHRGDVIAEIETEKTTVEMEAVASGLLVEIVHGSGVSVPVGDPIAYLDDEE